MVVTAYNYPLLGTFYKKYLPTRSVGDYIIGMYFTKTIRTTYLHRRNLPQSWEIIKSLKSIHGALYNWTVVLVTQKLATIYYNIIQNYKSK